MSMAAAVKHMEMLNSLIMAIQKEIPAFRLVIKERHWLFRGILRFWPSFHRGVTTTIYPNVYMPCAVHDDVKMAWKVLAHEFVHLTQMERNKWLFFIKYCFPQVLFVLALLSIFAGPYFLAALVCLLPLPAYWRMKYEMEGYIMTMAVNYWRHGYVHNDQKAFIKNIFTSSTYYYMWPFKRWIDRKINTASVDIERGYYDELGVYKTVRLLMQDVWGLK